MISISNVTKSFPGAFMPVFQGLNLEIQEGEFCALIGPNGCGKSTLIKLIAGEYLPDSGHISLKSQVASVVQDTNLGTIADMSVLENIALSMSINPRFLFFKRHRLAIITKIKELEAGLESKIDQPIQILSGGQRQMIATLMAINLGRKILLLDEHTSALDPKMHAVLMEYTYAQATQKRLTTIMITHKMESAIKYCDRIIVLHKGKIVMDASKEQKQKLTHRDLLDTFHRCEDETFLSD